MHPRDSGVPHPAAWGGYSIFEVETFEGLFQIGFVFQSGEFLQPSIDFLFGELLIFFFASVFDRLTVALTVEKIQERRAIHGLGAFAVGRRLQAMIAGDDHQVPGGNVLGDEASIRSSASCCPAESKMVRPL